MEFNVPQFIEEEDKIIGFLTLKQFFYVAGVGALLFILYFTLSFGLFIIFAIIIAPAALILVVKKYNGQPLLSLVGLWIKYQLKPKLYLWKKK